MENTHEIRWFGRTDIIPRPCLFGLHLKKVSDKQGYCGYLQKYVRIKDFCLSYGKTISFREIGCEKFLMIVWHGRSCKEVRGKILRTGEQNNSTPTLSRHTVPWRPPIQRRRIEIRGRIVKNMLSNCSEMPFHGSYWETWYSLVCEQTCSCGDKMD